MAQRYATDLVRTCPDSDYIARALVARGVRRDVAQGLAELAAAQRASSIKSALTRAVVSTGIASILVFGLVLLLFQFLES